MHILIVHGYLLDASGSCTYVRNLAKGFKSQGHIVTVACQDHSYKSDMFNTFLPMEYGKDNILPVYVYNPYDGYKAKCITDMTDEEIENHITMVSKSLGQYIIDNKIDFIFTNHCLFSPVNVKRALQKYNIKIPYVCKIHGSGLNYSFVPDYNRLLPYVKEGLDGAQKVICGSSYMKERFIEVMGNMYDVSIIPCGVDTKLFSLGERTPFKARMIFFGHILDKKGVAEIVTAFPFVKDSYPNAELYLAGNGTYDINLTHMLEAMEQGDKNKYIEWARKNDFIDPTIDIKQYFRQFDVSGIKRLGYINHNTLKDFLASSDIMLAPSKACEAFGMVTIEAMAAGVYPVVSNHSGLKNVVDLLETKDKEFTDNMRIIFKDDSISIPNIVSVIIKALNYVQKNNPSDRLKSLSLEFDWKNICEKILS